MEGGGQFFSPSAKVDIKFLFNDLVHDDLHELRRVLAQSVRVRRRRPTTRCPGQKLLLNFLLEKAASGPFKNGI